jgi:hypothetical protein
VYSTCHRLSALRLRTRSHRLRVSVPERKSDIIDQGNRAIVADKREATDFNIPLCRFPALVRKWAVYCIASWPSQFKVTLEDGWDQKCVLLLGSKLFCVLAVWGVSRNFQTVSSVGNRHAPFQRNMIRDQSTSSMKRHFLEQPVVAQIIKEFPAF